MNIVLYGKDWGVFAAEELLKSITKVKKVSVFEYFPSVLEYFERYKVDMVFLDADDATIDWQYLLQRFRKINKQIKVVLLSSDENEAVRAYEEGVFDYLIKPVKKKQLERVVLKV